MMLRDYQQEAEQSFIDYWLTGGGHALAELATGTGKSLLVASKAMRLKQEYPDFRSIVLCPSKELVSQNFKTMLKLWPGAPTGVCCSGLGRRDMHHPITFATINSVFRKPHLLGDRHLIQIDEAHLLPPGDVGMYHELISGLQERVPDLRVAGYTASPYRMDMGRLDSGEGRLFEKTVYTYGIGKATADGWLKPLVSPASIGQRVSTSVDLSGVARRGGEFVVSALGEATDQITKQAVAELVELGRGRKAWLAFCPGIKNATLAAAEIRSHGITCEVIHGEMSTGQRDNLIRAYRNRQIQCLTNADLLTTGFDVPFIDLIALFRATLSTSLFVQICGRGTRPVFPSWFDPNKADANERKQAIAGSDVPDCLVVDFAGNIRRHGPVDDIEVRSKTASKDDGKVTVDTVRAKECPGCQELVSLNTFTCKVCNHEWPHEEKPKHDPRAESQLGIMSTEKVPPQQLPVVDWSFRIYRSDMGEALEINIMAGLNSYREWAAFDGASWGRQKGCEWWSQHGGALPFPETATEAMDRRGELSMPSTITVERSPKKPKYFNITGRSFASKQGRAAA